MTEHSAPVTVHAADLVDLVCAVPGVAGIEPGIATTLRAVDARLRRSDADRVRYGLIVHPVTGDVVVEIGLTGDRPVRSVVEQVQRILLTALEEDPSRDREVLVRVQSITR